VRRNLKKYSFMKPEIKGIIALTFAFRIFAVCAANPGKSFFHGKLRGM